MLDREGQRFSPLTQVLAKLVAVMMVVKTERTTSRNDLTFLLPSYILLLHTLEQYMPGYEHPPSIVAFLHRPNELEG